MYSSSAESKGDLAKLWVEIDKEDYLVKGNSKRNGVICYEPYSEVIVSILLDILKIQHITYFLEDAAKYPEIKMYGTVEHVSVCKSYKKTGKQRLNALELKNLYFGKRPFTMELLLQQEEIFQTAQVAEMFLVDAWVGNTDRHLQNWDYLVDKEGIEFVPVFDFGASLLSTRTIQQILKYSGIGPDNCKPFRPSHTGQIKLLSNYYSSKKGIGKIESVIEELKEKVSQTRIPEALGEKRYHSIITYLYNRFVYFQKMIDRRI